MDAESFDTELFIDEVEKRRCIWDMECPDYKNRVLKKSAWQEIVDVFAEENITKEEKTLLGHTLQKKWKHVRDNYSRELKKQKTLKTGSGASKSNPYIYFQRLQFLQPIVTNKAVTDSLENSNQLDDETELLHSQPRSDEPQTRAVDKNVNCNKRYKLNPVDKQFIDILNKSVALREQRHAEVPNKDDDDKLFCMSLYTELQKVPAHGRLRTKIQLLEVIQRAQEFYNPSQIPQVPPSYHSSYPPPQTFNQMNYGSNAQRHQFQPVQESSSSGLLMASAALSPMGSQEKERERKREKRDKRERDREGRLEYIKTDDGGEVEVEEEPLDDYPEYPSFDQQVQVKYEEDEEKFHPDNTNGNRQYEDEREEGVAY